MPQRRLCCCLFEKTGSGAQQCLACSWRNRAPFAINDMGLANERSKVTPALLLMSAHSAASTGSGGDADVDWHSLFSGDYWTISTCSCLNSLKSILFPKRKGRGQVVVRSVFCRRKCYPFGFCEENTCAQQHTSWLHYKDGWIAVCTTVFLLFAVLDFFFGPFFHLNAKNRWQLFPSFALQRGQACSKVVERVQEQRLLRGCSKSASALCWHFKGFIFKPTPVIKYLEFWSRGSPFFCSLLSAWDCWITSLNTRQRSARMQMMQNHNVPSVPFPKRMEKISFFRTLTFLPNKCCCFFKGHFSRTMDVT